MGNYLTLAVAGSRKTQGIVEYCSALPVDRKALVLTFTQTNQAELRERISVYAGEHISIQVLGWFTFLLRDFAHPFIPFKFPKQRVRGFNFDGRPYQMARGIRRFLDVNDAVFACELGRLANELIGESNGALIHRLECIYDEILIDEVQDLSSHDWEIVDALLSTSIDVRMVGDIRQSVLSTNPRSTKNKKYEYTEAIHWFRERERLGLLEITENSTTWRCHPEIASFSDTIFNHNWQFPLTNSMNNVVSGHDGVFLIRPEHIDDYIEKFNPKCLRHSASSGKAFDLEYMNFKISKGGTFERVLIVPTGGITKFIQLGTFLEPVPAASFYVAVTRAKQSVAIVISDAGSSIIPYWDP
jgi:DNA helicase-2/ATP-dependent DNA helicase PcrA